MFKTRRQKKMSCLLALASLASGCTSVNKPFHLSDTWESAPSYHTPIGTQIEYPTVASQMQVEASGAVQPLSLQNPAELPKIEMTLDEAIRMALTKGEVLRNIGGSVVQNPTGTQTKYNPAIAESNPLGGVEAALSAFDAQVTGQLFWQKNDRPNNTTFLVFQPAASQQTASTFSYEISKRTATGARFAARHAVNYDRNNNPTRFFQSDFSGHFEAEYRQPLMRGAGLDFNRIAGPNSQVGQYNGVLIARINNDISLADFEQGVITYINDVETAYWELFFSYHNLAAQVEGRNSSLLTWQRIKALQEAGARGGDAAAEAQARSQYYAFDIQVKEALSGANGLYAQEQRLRYLVGMTATDGSLLQPVSSPMEGEVLVDWHSSLADALNTRVEVRRQKWTIKRRELELIAAKLNRKPTLDFLAQYRYRGLGDDLFGSRSATNSFNSLYQNIFEGDYQEWQAGVEFSQPVGFRQAGAAVANARWSLAREQALLGEQELRITHDLSSAAREIQRSYALMQSNFVRLEADKIRVSALRERVVKGLDNINFLLQAQQQLATTESSYFRALVDYQLSLRNFHREKGSLLNYAQVGLSEASWPGAAYQDAAERGRFFAPRRDPSKVSAGPAVSRGGFDPTSVGQGVVSTVGTAQPAIPVPQAMPEVGSPAELDVSPSDVQGRSVDAPRGQLTGRGPVVRETPSGLQFSTQDVAPTTSVPFGFGGN